MTTINRPRRFRVLPYRQGSKGASALATALGGKVLKLQGSTFKPRPQDVIINWGNTENMLTGQFTVLNMVNLKMATNKLNFFKLMKEKGHDEIIPQFWTNRSEIPVDAYPIVCRTVLAGHSGDGIVIASTPDELVDAPLYVQYVSKLQEYRVHCGRHGLIFIQRKARKHDTPDDQVNWKIRNLANGFSFVAVEQEDVPEKVILAAQSALSAVDLDFGGCDVIWNQKKQSALVLEINSACGLEERTAKAYADYFRNSS